MGDEAGAFVGGIIVFVVIVIILVLVSADDMRAETICTAAGYTTSEEIDSEWYCIRTGDSAKVVSLEGVIEKMEALNE